MNRGFLDSGGRKSNHKKKTDTVTGIGSTLELVETSINVIPLVDFVEKEVLLPSVVDETVAKEKQRSLVNTTRLGSFPPLPSQENLSLVMPLVRKRVAYLVVANYVRDTWGKYGMVRSMFSSSTGLFSFQFSSSDGLNAMLENGSWFIRNNPLILKKWSSYARVMIELRVDVELKDNILAAMPKIAEEGYHTHNIYVEYECKSPRWNKNKNVEPTNEVSKSNSFDALNSVDNDVEFGTNRGSTHLASQEANSSSSTFWNAESSSPSTITPIIEKINKIENLIIDERAILVDNEGKPLSKVDDDSEDEVASVDNEMAGFLAKEDGYGHEIPEMLQAFCNRLDINVRGRMKK
ncbi:ribonuclease H-like domain, reverse transcriptase, RNA-dependent DNA polymerase [Tanacetum coccineum]